jgi:hypothetical protein
MSEWGENAGLVQKHFRRRRQAVLAAAAETVAEHTGLTGSHREAVVREFLQRILPHRFGIGTGMVYGVGRRSQQADIVLWDSANYPRLDMQQHTFFFADAVKLVIECKSNWSSAEFEDIRSKCKAVKDIITAPGLFGIESTLRLLQGQVAALRRGEKGEYSELVSPMHIATGAVVVWGGQHFDIRRLSADDLADVDDTWPDVMVLLEAGKVLTKDYSQAWEAGHGVLRLAELREDCLLIFTQAVLFLLSERVASIENAFYFDNYIPTLQYELAAVPFPLTRPPAGRTPVFEPSGE